MFIESEGKRRAVRITVWVAVLGLLLGVLSSIFGAVAADAHTALKSVTPADGDTVTTAPKKVTLEFNEPIGTSFATVSITGPSGDAGDGRPEVDGATVTQNLAANLPSGAYTVTFRVVSEDGHPVSDITKFTIAATPSRPSSSVSSEPTTTTGTTTAMASPSTTPPTESSSAATASGDHGGQTMRLGLAVGVGALAVSAGTALVAAARRRRLS